MMRQYWLPLKVLKKYTAMQVINEDYIANNPSIVSHIKKRIKTIWV